MLDRIKEMLHLRHIFKPCLTLEFFYWGRENLSQPNPLCSKQQKFLRDFKQQKNIQMICQRSFLFFINPLRLWRFLESLNNSVMKHNKQTSQVNRRPPNSPAVWHKQVFTLEDNNKVYSVKASVVLLQNWGVGECGIQWLRVGGLWLVAVSTTKQ